MSFGFRTEEYYKRFIELQEKLRKSEEERLKLEIKFNEMVRVTREEDQQHYKKLRTQYKRFLEEDRRRQDRNERILRTLERIESRVAMLVAKTERFKLLRHQYQTFLDRMYASNHAKDLPRTPKDDNDIVQTYLQNLSSHKLKEMLRKEDDTRPKLSADDSYADLYAKPNYANTIADDIMNSIYTRRSHDDAKQSKELLPQEPLKSTGAKYYSSDDNDKKVVSEPETDDFSESEEILYKNPAEFTKTLSKPGVDVKQRSFDKPGEVENMKNVEALGRIESNKEDGTVKELSREASHPSRQENVVPQPAEAEQFVELSESARTEIPPKLHADITENDSRFLESTQILEKEKKEEREQPAEESLSNLSQPPQEPESKITEQVIAEDQLLSIAAIEPQTQSEEEEPKAAEEQPREQLITTPLEDTSGLPPINDQTDFREEQYNDQAPTQYSEYDQSYEQYDENAQPQDQNQYYDESGQRYNEHGQPTDENGQVVPQYDENGQVLQQYDQSGYGLEQQYDENGQLIQPQYGESGQYNENGQLIQPQYDEGGQLIQPQYNESGQYDENGQLIQPQYSEGGQYDENGQLIQPQYDENGQLMQQYDENSQLIQPQYDENGQLMQQYDENGQLIQPQYDESGQLMQQYDENGQLIQSQYDENGQLVQPQYDENGQVIQQQYDDQYYPQQYEQNEDQTAQNVEKDGAAAEPSDDQVEVNKAEEMKKPSNVMEMLDTDTESIKQDTKVSHDSDFDFSNG